MDVPSFHSSYGGKNTSDLNCIIEVPSGPLPPEPPKDPRERCFNGVALKFAACMANSPSPLLCHAKRIVGLAACSAKKMDSD